MENDVSKDPVDNQPGEDIKQLKAALEEHKNWITQELEKLKGSQSSKEEMESLKVELQETKDKLADLSKGVLEGQENLSKTLEEMKTPKVPLQETPEEAKVRLERESQEQNPKKPQRQVDWI